MKMKKVEINGEEIYILNNSFLKSENIEIVPPYRNGLVLKGRDLVEYHNIETEKINNCLVPISKNRNELEKKLSGKKENQVVFLNQGALYTFYFKNKINKDLFINSPKKFLPALGGYCLWGLAYEWQDKDECQNAPQCNDNGLKWPWNKYIMGPPADTEFGWFIYENKLYFNFASYYRDKAIEDIKFSIKLASNRWKNYYSNNIGPINVRSWGAPNPQYRDSLELDKKEKQILINQINSMVKAIKYSSEGNKLDARVKNLVKDLVSRNLVM
tara:strand:+ start:964 stop:1776 length:813 start_codon:yes stop_codon:yes gene_type:complete